MEKVRILIVEDEAIIAMEIESQLQSLGYEVTSTVDTGEKAIEKAETDKPDLILMDIRIKGEMDGIDTAEVIRIKFGIPVIFSTAYLDQERIERAKITMPFGYVLKPIQERDLKVTFEMALYMVKVDAERKRMEDLLRIQRNLGIYLGKSMDFQEMLRLCLKAALEASNMDCGGIYIIDPATKSFDLAYHEGLSEDFVTTVSLFKSDSPQAQMVMTGDSSYANHDQIGVDLTEVEQNEKLTSMAIIPVEHANQIIGCLNVASRSFEEIPLFVRNTLETIVTQIGDAIIKKQVEDELKASEERFRTIFNKSFQFALILDTSGIVQKMNDLCYEVCGKLAEDSMGQPFENARWWINYNEIRQKTIDAIQIVKKGETASDEVIFIDKDGKLHNGIRIFSPITNDEGKLSFIAVVGLDVSTRIQAEEEVKNTKHILQETIDSSLSITSVKDLEGRYLFVSQKFEEYFGIKNTDILGKTDFDFLPNDLAEKYLEQDQKIAESGDSIIEKEEFYWNNQYNTYILNKRPLYDPNGIICAICVESLNVMMIKDITNP